MLTKMMYVLKAMMCAVLITQLAGCGTILYPARRGQQTGKIDAGVAVMDGVGLLLFVIPGVVAFAIDFSTGAIYLPGTSRSSLDIKNAKIVKFDVRHATNESLERTISKETGVNVNFSRADLKITRLRSMDDMNGDMAKVFDSERN